MIKIDVFLSFFMWREKARFANAAARRRLNDLCVFSLNYKSVSEKYHKFRAAPHIKREFHCQQTDFSVINFY